MLAEWKRTAAAAAMITVVLGAKYLSWPWWLTAAVICCVAWLVIGRQALTGIRNPHSAIILVGASTNLTIIGAILSGRRRGGIVQPVSHAGAEVIRVANCQEARERAAAYPRVEVVMDANLEGTATAIIDATGRTVTLVAANAVLERLLGRIPADLAGRDPCFAAESGASALTDPAASRIKRLVDVGASLLLLPVVAIPAALAALALWAESGRPLIIGGPRVGLRGRPFQLYLLRTTDLRSHIDGPQESPARPTQLGRLLRRMHLNLAPALWNVVRGDLSLVGPRPESPEDVARNQVSLPLFSCRHRVRPGLVSLAQVRFRYTDTLRDTRLAMEYDFYYVKHTSLALDARIFTRAALLLAHDCIAAAVTVARGVLVTGFSWVGGLQGGISSHAAAVASVALPPLDASAARLEPTLLVGAGEGGKLLVRELQRNPSWGLWPVAFADDDPDKVGSRVLGIPVLGDTETIAAIVRREQIETVVIAIPSAPEIVVNRIAARARRSDARVLTMPDLGALLRGGVSVAPQPVPIDDMLGRPVVLPDVERCRDFLAGRRVLVTGAAGSIGRELTRQVTQFGPASVHGIDVNESDLFDLQQALQAVPNAAPFVPIVASITNQARVEQLFAELMPEIVFHAAADKHVPMMEEYPSEAVQVNTIGTYELARISAAAGVSRFVLVSTDKAVRPSSVMGASKRLAELAVRAVAHETGLSACSVRFGNVLGSRGSVIPLFEKQIAAGGPVTVTDERMMRYFMTIPEAASLIIQAGAFGDDNVIYILDMGEEVSIRDLAERMIRLYGMRVGEDIEIVYTGLRPGEKLRESLSLNFEAARTTPHAKIRILQDSDHERARQRAMRHVIGRLTKAVDQPDRAAIRAAVMREISKLDGAVHTAADDDQIRSMPHRRPAPLVARKIKTAHA
ncbi:MAG: polysaccharide biosynthesis protein [Thermomicrobiales bacterium]